MLIYVWRPHGSKKLDNLTILDASIQNWFDKMTTPLIIMHDQEPLHFDLWSADEFAQRWENEIVQKKLTSDHQNPERVAYQTNLGLRGAVFPSSNLYDYVMIAHSEQNSDQIKQYENHGFLPVYYWSHALIAVDWFRYAQHDPLLDYAHEYIDHDFLIYNRAWTGSREYRLTFIDLLSASGMAHKCLITFSPIDDNKHYTDHQFKNTALSITNTRLHEMFAPNQHSSSASADYNSVDYHQSGIEVVLETLFDDTRWHLTEKTLRPIACGKPFMLAATPGSLQYLKNYGFETFSKYINEDYDLIVNPRDRLQAIVAEMTRIAELSIEQKSKLLKNLHVIAKRNQQRFFSLEWQHSIEQEFYHNLDHAMTTMNKNCTGKYWRESLPMLLKTMPTSASIQNQQAIEHWLAARN